jgi:DMSO/TMAO reductase YedYZ molybdopterin-dependent catalytic subunit
VFRSKAEQKVADAGYDPARLPPGQYLTEKWPVLHAGLVPETDLATWDFKIFGEVENPITLSWEQLQELPASEITIDIHCVTRWSRFDTSFRGVPLARPRRAGWAEAERPLRRRLRGAGLYLEHPARGARRRSGNGRLRSDGEPLEPEHGWPLRLVVPSRYFWKSAKWLRGLELLDHDQPGYWERYGYHNDADYWQEQRYAF